MGAFRVLETLSQFELTGQDDGEEIFIVSLHWSRAAGFQASMASSHWLHR
jgi:hypothetical protein